MSMNFEKHKQKATIILKELASELGEDKCIINPERLIKAVFHALRERLTTEQSLKLIVQLPLFLKAVYVDGWKISTSYHTTRHLKEFINKVYKESIDKDLKNPL